MHIRVNTGQSVSETILKLYYILSVLHSAGCYYLSKISKCHTETGGVCDIRASWLRSFRPNIPAHACWHLDRVIVLFSAAERRHCRE